MPSQINFQSAANPVLSVVTIKGTGTTGSTVESGSGLIEFSGTSSSNDVYIKSGRLLPILITPSNGNYTCNLRDCNTFHIVAGSAITGNINLTNPIVGQTGHLVIKNSSANTHSITWKQQNSTSGIKWQGGSAPTMTTTSGSFDIVSYYIFHIDSLDSSNNEILLASSTGHA